MASSGLCAISRLSVEGCTSQAASDGEGRGAAAAPPVRERARATRHTTTAVGAAPTLGLPLCGRAMLARREHSCME